MTYGVLGLRRVSKPDRLIMARKYVRTWLRTHRPDIVVVEKTYRHPVPWLPVKAALVLFQMFLMLDPPHHTRLRRVVLARPSDAWAKTRMPSLIR